MATSKPASFNADPGLSASQEQRAFSRSFNNSFNEQFNRDYVQQEHLLAQNPRFSRTRQSIEAERRDRVGQTSDLAPYPLYQEDTLKPTTIRHQAFNHVVECNLLNQLFLSPENIEHLQQRIRYEVYKASNQQHVIGRQSERELVIIMRSIYLTYGKNIPTALKQQISDLNDLVVLEVVPKILSEIQAHVRYLWDASTQPMPLAWPQNMSTKGQKILPSVTSVYNT
jgi:hypothetical protein